MFKPYVVTLILLVGAGSAPALALSAGDSMSDWSQASEGDRAAVLDGLGPTLSQAYQAEKADLLTCLDRVSREAPHAALAIRDMARACVAIVEHRDPDGAPGGDEIKV